MRRWRRLVAILLGAPLALACAGMTAEREACFAAADGTMIREAYDACKAKGYTWTKCPARDSIVAEAVRTRKACQ